MNQKNAKTDQEKWAKLTIDLLKSLFADLSIDNEFGSVDILYFPQTDRPKLLAGWMTARIHHLESIIERLPLFSSAEEMTGGVAASGLATAIDTGFVNGLGSTVTASSRPKSSSASSYPVHTTIGVDG